MKALIPLKRYFPVLALLLASGFAAYSQDPAPADARPVGQPDQRPDILRQLGLSPQQVQQFRMVNAEWREQRLAAQRRLREANRDLDLAIYADQVDEKLVAERLVAFQQAQAEVARVRINEELAVRKILTGDQLFRFREIRRRFAQARENMEMRRRAAEQPQRPARRPLQRREPQFDR